MEQQRDAVGEQLIDNFLDVTPGVIFLIMLDFVKLPWLLGAICYNEDRQPCG